MATSISRSNIHKPAPVWFRKIKKAAYILTVAANSMIASWGLPDQLLVTRLQLWCTIGIVAILEAAEAVLADGEDEELPVKLDA
jgi:hypothetical protein